MSKKRIKQYLMLLTVIGLVSIASGSGTFASFSAETTNAGNTFASGTLFLHNTKQGNAACTSESHVTAPYNVNGSCDILFNGVAFDGTAQTAHLALNNAGTLDASALTFKVANCTVGDNSANTTSGTLFGGALTCGDINITIQETQSNYSTNVWCAYGPDQAACGATTNTYNLGGPTSLTALNTSPGPATAAGLAHGNTRYYVITVQPNTLGGNGNQWQNRAASFDLTWNIA
jgi:predicted ribosomally synthesized peptide with SipW-like signal peptide